MVEMKKVIIDLFKSFRGERSRKHFARLLDIDQSTVYSWEIGKTKPAWSHVKTLFNRHSIDLDGLLKQRIPVENPSDGPAILHYYAEVFGMDKLIYMTELGTGSIKKILAGDQSPKAETILNTIFKGSPYLFFHLIECSIGLDSIPNLKSYKSKWDMEVKLSKKYPYLAGIIFILERGLKKPEALQRIQIAFQIPQALALDIIDKLIEVNIVKFEHGKYFLAQKHWFDSGFDYSLLGNLHYYWGQRALDRIPKNRDFKKSLNYGYKVMSVSDSEYTQVLKEYSIFLDRIKRISDNSNSNMSKTVAVTVQIVDIESDP